VKIGFAIVCLCLLASPAAAATLQALVLPMTGEIRLKNTTSAPLPFVFYSIKSPGGALVSSSQTWKSIADNYDASGDGMIDSRGEWVKISASLFELAEGVLIGPGGSLPPQKTVSLGEIWNRSATQFPDLDFDLIQMDGQPSDISVEFVLDGDYIRDGMIDAADYVTWRNSASTTVPEYMGADGNGDGFVSEADYSVWRSNFGAVLRPDGGINLGSARGAAIATAPEPASCLLVALGTMSILTWFQRTVCHCLRRTDVVLNGESALLAVHGHGTWEARSPRRPALQLERPFTPPRAVAHES
jgi:hypothetical protein